MRNIDVIDMRGCVVRDEAGHKLARIVETDGVLQVHPFSECRLGDYFYILWYLRELGWDVE